jgi:peptidoglycan hydrolase-like protein with peptidoglycan-binding domain
MRKIFVMLAIILSFTMTPFLAGAFQLSSPGTATVISSFDHLPDEYDGDDPTTPPSPVSRPARCTVLTRTMWLGAQDDRNGGEVTLLQAFLKRAGFYKGDTTGHFNKKTEDALLAWQEANDVTPQSTQFFRTILNDETIDRIRELSCNFRPAGFSGSSLTPEPCALVWDEHGRRIPQCGEEIDEPINGTLTTPRIRDNVVRPGDLRKPDRPRVYRTHGNLPNDCVALTRVFWRGATNRTTNGEVSKLQKYLESQYGITDGAYDPRGYFGEATEAMLLEWQKDNDIAPEEFNGHPTYVNDETINALRKSTCGSRNNGGYTTCTMVTGRNGDIERGRCSGRQVFINEGQKCPRNAYCVVRGRNGSTTDPVGKIVSPNGGETLMIDTLTEVTWELDRIGDVRVMLQNVETGSKHPIISGHTQEGTDVGWYINPDFEPGEYKLLLQYNGIVLDESDDTFELIPYSE